MERQLENIIKQMLQSQHIEEEYLSEDEDEEENARLDASIAAKFSNMLQNMSRQSELSQSKTKRPQAGDMKETDLSFNSSAKPFHYLSIPPTQRNYLLSPPPSPPSGWRPIREDVNRIAHVDLEPFQEDDRLVLFKEEGRPMIMVTATD
eukprot:TRINITY_DN367_c0_g1_i1.p1 TRINITY_DN367_c0_g1~~TRINITY_DN367_c0_g1_i1.p1  ORF type:complete len:149 (-),score=55.64 TRINITY_DN367_c0_g1_i1:259-705(-)